MNYTKYTIFLCLAAFPPALSMGFEDAFEFSNVSKISYTRKNIKWALQLDRRNQAVSKQTHRIRYLKDELRHFENSMKYPQFYFAFKHFLSIILSKKEQAILNDPKEREGYLL